MSNWCWAAVASSVSEYYAQFYENGAFWTQRKLVQAVFNNQNCTNQPQICNKPYSLANVLQRMRHLGQETSTVSLTSLQKELDELRPVCCQVKYNNGLTHFVALYGYDDDDLLIADPEIGYHLIDYHKFKDNYRGGNWIRTFATKPKT